MSEFPGFVGASYTLPAQNVDAEDLINLYVERADVDTAKSPAALLPIDGVTLKATLPQTPGRGMLTQNGRTFVVGGITAYELSAGYALTALGNMVQDGNPATLNTNGPAGHQIFITSGGSIYVYDLVSSAFTDVTATWSVSTATFGGFLDGRFLVLDTATSTLYISTLEDGLAADGSAQRDTAGDNWISMLVTHENIWLFGSQRTDVWQDVGAANFPFAPVQGTLITQGIAAPFSAAVVDNAPIWLGANEDGIGIVWRADGYVPRRISTHAVESAIQGYGTISDAVAWTYQKNGHEFYVLTFPTVGVTWVYDAATGLWHKRGLWDSAARRYTAYRPQFHCYANDAHLTCDRASGAIWALDSGVSLDVDGAGIRRLRRCPYLSKEQQRVYYQSLQLDLEVGLGTQIGQGTDPQIMLRWSNNQAQTWSNEHWESAGKVGAYQTRVIWDRLGVGRNRVFEIAMTDPVPYRITGAYLQAEVGIN